MKKVPIHSTISNQRIWRVCVERAALRTSNQLEAICPFGFEIFRDVKFHKIRIHRYYIYLGSRKKIGEETDIIQSYSNCLEQELSIFSIPLHERFRVITEGTSTDAKNGFDPCRDSLVRIQYREISIPLIEDYAIYVLSSINGLTSKKLRESVDFELNSFSRRRYFQLALMLETLFSRYIEALPNNQYKQLWLFANRLLPAKSIKSKPTAEQVAFQKDVVIPRLCSFRELLLNEGSKSIISISAIDYHGSEQLQIQGCADILETLIDAVISSYTIFPYL